MNEALILGYFGAGNFGDELILESFLKGYGDILRDKRFSLTLTVKAISGEGCTDKVREVYGELGFVRISPFLPYSIPVKKATHLIAPGGSLLQNSSSTRSLVLYLAVIREFIKAGKKVLLLNQGIGPIYGSFWHQVTRNLLSKVTFFSGRDMKSALYVADVLPPERRFLSSDAVFARTLEFPSPAGENIPYEYGFIVKGDVRSPLLGSPEFPPDANIIIAALQKVEWENPRKLERLGKRLDKESLKILSPDEFCRTIRNCEVIVSERYHGLVMALLAGIPFVGIGDDPKITSFCDECGMPYHAGTRVALRTLKELKESALSRFDRKAFYDRVSDFSARHRRQRQLIAGLL